MVPLNTGHLSNEDAHCCPNHKELRTAVRTYTLKNRAASSYLSMVHWTPTVSSVDRSTGTHVQVVVRMYVHVYLSTYVHTCSSLEDLHGQNVLHAACNLVLSLSFNTVILASLLNSLFPKPVFQVYKCTSVCIHMRIVTEQFKWSVPHPCTSVVMYYICTGTYAISMFLCVCVLCLWHLLLCGECV